MTEPIRQKAEEELRKDYQFALAENKLLEAKVKELENESKICTGCGHNYSVVPSPALGCCPDSRYRTAKQFYEERTEWEKELRNLIDARYKNKIQRLQSLLEKAKEIMMFWKDGYIKTDGFLTYAGPDVVVDKVFEFLKEIESRNAEGAG